LFQWCTICKRAEVRGFSFDRFHARQLSRRSRQEKPIPSVRNGATEEALTVLNASVDRLGSTRSTLTDEAIGREGYTLMKLRDCSPDFGQIPPHRALRNQTVEASVSGPR
jgi:hypothetical protein